MKSSPTSTKKKRPDKAEQSSQSKKRSKNQDASGVLKKPLTDKYTTCREDIAEVEIDSIQPCPIIPDYKTPTLSTQPIVVRTPEACFCIDGWHDIEQAKAAGRSTIRCHILHIVQHSDTELAIRKVAIRVLPQGGKCSYAELVCNTYRLYRALKDSLDDLVLFSHGGDRRGDDFTSSQENNIRLVLASRLGKSQTTINKYLQHGAGLNDAAMESLVDAGATKTFFEAFQTEKQIEIAALKAERKDQTAIELDISSQVSVWLDEFNRPVPPNDPPPPQADPASDVAQNPRCLTPRHRVSQVNPGNDGSPTIDPATTNHEGVAVELKRIGEALIEIADGQPRPTPQQVETIRRLILELSTLLQRLTHADAQEGDETGGTA